MADHPNKTTHQILLDALVAFVTEHPNPKVQRFRQTMLNWGEAWTDVPPIHLPAPDTFEQAHSLAHSSTASLMGLFVQDRAALK